MPETEGSEILVPVSPGELLDKIGILDLKLARIGEAAKLENIRREHERLTAIAARTIPQDPRVARARSALDGVNARLWDVEDRLRAHEAAGRFDAAFVADARAVYRLNDARAALKKRINLLLGSALVEEKSYGTPAPSGSN